MVGPIDSWKVWFSEGRTFTSAEHNWAELPQEGCLGLVVLYERGYKDIIHQFDWVYKEDGEFISTLAEGYDGTYVEAPRAKCGACVKKGLTVSDEEWEKVHSEMLKYGGS